MRIILLAMAAWSFTITAFAEPAVSHEYRITPVPFTAVDVPGGFWKARLDACRDVTIPYCFKKCEETPRIQNFEVAGGLKDGKFGGIYFDDSDVYKVMEGAAYVLALRKDEKLDKYLDELIAKVAAAQEPDGYLYSSRTIFQKAQNKEGQYVPPGGNDRWTDPGGHELYCLGHMYEAACAHYQATGKRNFLDIALKSADLICKTFGTDKPQNWPPGHQEIEIGLARLYRLTGEQKYLDQAKYFLDIRGAHEGRTFPPYGDYNQDHAKVTDQREAVGHAVRALYLYSGMADVAALTGDKDYVKAIKTIWDDIMLRKLYVTGGLGAIPEGEKFGAAYQLPNDTAYCETCAQIAGILFAHRMFLASGESEYIDMLEKILYNAMISGVSMKGDTFFYPNLLTVPQGGVERQLWFGCSCCPSNVCRFLASMPSYIYAVEKDVIFVNLYATSKTTVDAAGQKVSLEQETAYPWDGKIKLTVKTAGRFTLKCRVPGWVRGIVAPGDEPIYRFMPQGKLPLPTAAVAGKALNCEKLEAGYLAVTRDWKAGDVLELNFPMTIQRVVADERVEADRGKVALQRGPIVFCVEQQDVDDQAVCSLLLKDDAPLEYRFQPNLLNGVGTLHGQVMAYGVDEKGVESTKEVAFQAVPYYAWDHRTPKGMSVWLARQRSAVVPKTFANGVFATASGTQAQYLNDNVIPKDASEHDCPRMHWWPAKGTKQWMQYDLPKAIDVSGVEIYWFDDTGRGECRVPASWKLFYKKDGSWTPVANPSGFGLELNKFNRTTFDKIHTDGIRVEMQSQPDWAGGVYEWRFF